MEPLTQPVWEEEYLGPEKRIAAGRISPVGADMQYAKAEVAI